MNTLHQAACIGGLALLLLLAACGEEVTFKSNPSGSGSGSGSGGAGVVVSGGEGAPQSGASQDGEAREGTPSTEASHGVIEGPPSAASDELRTKPGPDAAHDHADHGHGDHSHEAPARKGPVGNLDLKPLPMLPELSGDAAHDRAAILAAVQTVRTRLEEATAALDRVSPKDRKADVAEAAELAARAAACMKLLEALHAQLEKVKKG